MIDTMELKVYMMRNDLNVTELARKIGKSPATVRRWIERKNMPTEYAEKIMQVLDIPREKAVYIFFNEMFPVELQKVSSQGLT